MHLKLISFTVTVTCVVACLVTEPALAATEVNLVTDTQQISQEDVIKLWEALSAEFERYVAGLEREQQRFFALIQHLLTFLVILGGVLAWILGNNFWEFQKNLQQTVRLQTENMIDNLKQHSDNTIHELRKRTDSIINERLALELADIHSRVVNLKTMLDREIKYKTARIVVVALYRIHHQLEQFELSLLRARGLRVHLCDENDVKLKDTLSGADVIIYVCGHDLDTRQPPDFVVDNIISFLRRVSHKFPSLENQPPIIIYTLAQFSGDQMKQFFDIYRSVSMATTPQTLLTQVLIQAFFAYRVYLEENTVADEAQ